LLYFSVRSNLTKKKTRKKRFLCCNDSSFNGRILFLCVAVWWNTIQYTSFSFLIFSVLLWHFRVKIKIYYSGT
jgi:hypothetical protein